jgi:hypothetical protein
MYIPFYERHFKMDQIKRHVLNIDSKERSSGTTDNFIIHLNENEFHEVKYVQLKDIAFANTMYNIRASTNKLNWVDNSAIAYSLKIPIGFYSLDELIAYVNATTPALHPGCPIQFSSNTKTRKITIISVTAFHLATTSTVLDIIGFPAPSQVNLLIHIATDLYNFLVTPYVHVLSSTLAECDSLVASNGRKYGVIATVPIVVPFGHVVNKSEEKTSSDESMHNANVNLSTIDIRLVDSNFEPIDLNGTSVIINFTVARS